MEFDTAQGLLDELCADLRLLWMQAGGPSLRVLSGHLPLSKSQVSNILAGRIRQPPDPRVVHALVRTVVQYAQRRGRAATLTVPTGADEFWRPRCAVVEHAFQQRRAGRPVNGPANGARYRAAVPRQLPPGPPAFVGRARELTALHDLLAGRRAAGGLAVATIAGPAGAGKTALALHWSHQVAAQFPDGQLFTVLQGPGPGRQPVEPASSLGALLAALGVPPERVPADVAGRAALYRTLLADRRMLVVLDDAVSAAQVRPLLPGCSGCLVLVTGRRILTDLVALEGAHPIILGSLPTPDAVDLLIRRLGVDRVGGDRDALVELARLCAHLPLALSTVAARLLSHPELSVPALVTQLRLTA